MFARWPRTCAAWLILVAVACHSKLEWQPSHKPGYYTPTQFGIHRFQLSGLLELANHTHAPVTAHVYLKCVVQKNSPEHTKPDHVTIRAIVYLYDATERSSVKSFEQFDIHILTVASYLDRLSARPVFTLTDVHSETSHEFHVVRGTTASPAKARLDEDDPNATAERWMHQVGHDFHSSILPYVLTMNMSLNTLRAARHTGLKFCINDWYQCAMIAVEQLGWHNLAIHTAQHIAAHQEQHMHDALMHHDAHGGRRLHHVGSDAEHPHPAPRRMLFQQQEDASPLIYVLTKPMYAMPPLLACSLLLRRLEHHMALGFDGVLYYERGQMLYELAHHPEVSSAIADGRIPVMMYSHEESGVPVTEPFEFWGLWDQWVLYSHAAMALWGTNTYILYTDLDEFVRIPAGVGVQELLRPGGCLHNTVYAQFSRYNYDCKAGGFQWAQERNLTSIPHEFFRMCVHREPDWKEWGKTLAWADAISYQQAHDGFVFPEYMAQANGAVEYACASIVHLHTLFTHRAHETPQEIDDVWLGPFAT